jgi:hypothetical protein
VVAVGVDTGEEQGVHTDHAPVLADLDRERAGPAAAPDPITLLHLVADLLNSGVHSKIRVEYSEANAALTAAYRAPTGHGIQEGAAGLP